MVQCGTALRRCPAGSGSTPAGGSPSILPSRCVPSRRGNRGPVHADALPAGRRRHRCQRASGRSPYPAGEESNRAPHTPIGVSGVRFNLDADRSAQAPPLRPHFGGPACQHTSRRTMVGLAVVAALGSLACTKAAPARRLIWRPAALSSDLTTCPAVLRVRLSSFGRERRGGLHPPPPEPSRHVASAPPHHAASLIRRTLSTRSAGPRAGAAPDATALSRR